MMHAFEEGIIPYILHILFDPMPVSMQSDIDLYMEYILSKSNLRSSEQEFFPRVNFTWGFTRLTLLTASEKVGALMALVLFLKTERGKTILFPRFQKSSVIVTNKQNDNPTEPIHTKISHSGKRSVQEGITKITYNPKSSTHQNKVKDICKTLFLDDIIMISKKSLNKMQQEQVDRIIFDTCNKDICNASIIGLTTLQYCPSKSQYQEQDDMSFTKYKPKIINKDQIVAEFNHSRSVAVISCSMED